MSNSKYLTDAVAAFVAVLEEEMAELQTEYDERQETIDALEERQSDKETEARQARIDELTGINDNLQERIDVLEQAKESAEAI